MTVGEEFDLFFCKFGVGPSWDLVGTLMGPLWDPTLCYRHGNLMENSPFLPSCCNPTLLRTLE